MAEADIHKLLNLEGDFNVEFDEEELNQVLATGTTKENNSIRGTATTDNTVEREKIHDFIDRQKKFNTVRSTKRDLKLFYEFIVKRGEVRNIEHIPPVELDVLLSCFYIEARKRDGSQYEPVSISSVKASIERHLKDKDTEYSLHDRTFKLSNMTLSAKKVELKKDGKGQKPNASTAVSSTEENLLWDKGQLGNSSPRVLIFSVWYYFTKCFGLRGRQEHRQLMFGDVELKTDTPSGREYLEFTERLTKTRDGNGKENVRKVKPKMYATNNDRDPVKLYKTYIDRRGDDAKKADFPFYLTCIPVYRINSNIWYYSRPMGENSLANLMPMAAKECGLEHKTNHSVRKSCVKTLRKAGVARDKIKHVTGHKSTLSIESYDDGLSDDEQMEMSDILTNKTHSGDTTRNKIQPAQNQNVPVTATCTTVAIPAEQNQQMVKVSAAAASSSSEEPCSGLSTMSNLFGAGSVLNNCTFNINMNMAHAVKEPKHKYRRIIYFSDSSQEA